MRDFLGKTGSELYLGKIGKVDYQALKGGLNAVPLTISGDCG